MNFTESTWNGFRRIDFEFDSKPAILVFPEKPVEGNKWLFKTEYFGAFPAFEIEMLGLGYHLAHVENTTRWCLPEDTDRQAAFADFLHREFGLNEKCLPVGMSCGGMQAVYLAAKYPEKTAAIYIDAPVMNFLSCPCGLGEGQLDCYDEFYAARGLSVVDLLNYREHPIDFAPNLIRNRTPVMLICGDSDTDVPYPENGKVLAEILTAAGTPFVHILKPGCDHHPHGLEDNEPLIRWAKEVY